MSRWQKVFWLAWLLAGSALLAFCADLQSITPPDLTPAGRTMWFTATAWNGSLESDYAAPVALTFTNTPKTVTLAWDAPDSSNVTSYTVYRSRELGNWTNSFDAGTNCNLTLQMAATRPSNLVVSVTSYGCTNLQYRAPPGPWILAGFTNGTWTNPAWGVARLWRGVGRPAAVKRVAITEDWQ